MLLLCYQGMEQNKEEVLFMLLGDLYEEKGCFCALSSGSSSPLDIPSLYENAVFASNYWNEQPVVSFSSIDSALSSAPSFSYPYERLDSLAQSLKKHTFSTARQEFHALFHLIENSVSEKDSLPDFFVRCVLIDMLTALMNSMNQASIKFKTYSDLYFETLYDCRSCPYEEKRSEIQANMEQLLTLFEMEFENKLINSSQIRELALKEYASPDFSISYLADTFHVSIAYMSYLFKKEMGENFSDYLWELRLEKAKELLLTTQMSIDEISIAVGYVNTSSFRRKFKSATGMAPSQFRTESPS